MYKMVTIEEDPLCLSGLSEAAILAEKAENEKKKTGAKKPPTKLELEKEARLKQKETRLNQEVGPKQPQAPTKAAAAKAVEGDGGDKSGILDKIHAYRERFPNLKKRNNCTAKSSQAELLDELHYMELQLGTSSDYNMGRITFCGAMSGLETVVRDYYNPLGLNLSGLGAVTRDNYEEFQPIIDELMIKYSAGVYTSPEIRLALAVGGMLVTVNAANSGDPRLAKAVDKMGGRMKGVPEGADDL